MVKEHIKLPRLYTAADLQNNIMIPLTESQIHYLRHVLRRNDGDQVRLFNGRDGEWLAALVFNGKKSAAATPQHQLIAQPSGDGHDLIELIFAPIKKARLDWLTEKAVELGATKLTPVISQNSEVRTINTARMTQQLAEAAEQCERLSVPALSELQSLSAYLAGRDEAVPLLACIERQEDAPPIMKALPARGALALLIGPEGGFTAEEKALIKAAPGSTVVSLGPQILRSETAACYALIAAALSGTTEKYPGT